MKAGKSSETAVVLPSDDGKFLHRLEGLFTGSDAADQFDQFHHRNRVHEVNADEALRPVGDGGKTGDRNRRRVGAENEHPPSHAGRGSRRSSSSPLRFRWPTRSPGHARQSPQTHPPPLMRAMAAVTGLFRDLARLHLAHDVVADRCQMPASIRSRLTSLRPTSYPARAHTWAMPEPICPAPMTPIFLIFILVSWLKSIHK